jgi:hypothetical protein
MLLDEAADRRDDVPKLFQPTPLMTKVSQDPVWQKSFLVDFLVLDLERSVKL